MPRIPKKRKLETPNQLDEAICTLEASQLEVDLFFKTLKDLYINDQLCDISFKVGNQQFRAHRVVLASANNFLGAMILSGMQESEMPIIEIQEEAHLFKYILDYIYGVRVELPSSDIISLLGLANHYSMVNLRDKLGEMLANNLTVKNCCTIYAAADLNSCENLKRKAEGLIFNNFATVSKTAGFYELSQTLLEGILSSDEILDCDESFMFEAVNRYVDVNKNREPAIDCSSILRIIRFPLMDSCVLSDVIKNHPLMCGTDRVTLLLEAFEHHALRAAGREGISNSRTKPRKQSCSFSQSTLLHGHDDSVSALVVYEDWLISGSWDSCINIWSTDTWNCEKTLSDHGGAIRDLCVCNDKIISCSDDGEIMVWSPGSWTCDRTLVGADDGAVNALVECRGRLASAGDDGVIKLWSSHTWACEVTVHHTIHDEEGVESAAQVGVMSLEVCDDKLVSGGDDSIIRIWNTNSWTCERIISAHHDEVWAIFMTPMGSLITGSVDSTIRLWHQQVINPGNRTLNGHQLTRVSTPVLSHSSSLVTNSSGINSSYTVAGDDRSNNGGEEPSVDWICDQTIQSDGPVYALCCLDNFVVSAGSGSKISVWRSNGEGPSIEQLTLHKWFDTTETGIWSLAVAKGKLISGSVDGNIRVWT